MNKHKLVPVEPDDAMVAELWRVLSLGASPRHMLRAAITAAPTPVMPELPEAYTWVNTHGIRLPLFAPNHMSEYAAQFAAAQNAELQARIDELENSLRQIPNT